MEMEMDRPRLRRWLGALEKPQPLCPFCQELATPDGPRHDACMRMWAKLLRFAFPIERDHPDDCEHDRRLEPCPCDVVSREARVNVLAARFDRKEALWHEGDLCQMPDLDGLALEVTRLANGSIAEGEVLNG
jgi:hypothetical protein